MSTEPYTIYFAGDMFDHKHLAGNAILADAIEQRSNHKYKCIVPQTIEQVSNRGVDIRNMDLKHVMDCDLGIFNFDGPDLDSGTVVEFMYAKLLDIPAVILRTDFRGGGDGDGGRLGWNLMASFIRARRLLSCTAWPYSVAWPSAARRWNSYCQSIIGKWPARSLPGWTRCCRCRP